MRGSVVTILVVAVLLAATAGAVSAQTEPEFKLGFKALADQIPDVAGDPTEEEHYAANGDSLQQTTTGLMAWRKADNWTAFTNGSHSWINGPSGVQDRSNDVRFVWEQDTPSQSPAPPSPAPASPPPPPPTYSAEVKAMDMESAGPGGVVKRLMTEIDAGWSGEWGWRSSKPVTVYMFTGGYHMTNGMPSITGQQLTADQRKYYAEEVPALVSADAQNGGWAVIMNVANGMGTPDWETIMRATLIRQYSYVMERDAAGNAGATWFLEGLARVNAESKVPADPLLRSEMTWLYDSKRRSILPTLTKLHQDWAGFVSISSSSMATANGMSFLAVRIVADKVGMGGLMEILRRTARGEAFESALGAVSGYSVAQLDALVKAKL